MCRAGGQLDECLFLLSTEILDLKCIVYRRTVICPASSKRKAGPTLFLKIGKRQGPNDKVL